MKYLGRRTAAVGLALALGTTACGGGATSDTVESGAASAEAAPAATSGAPTAPAAEAPAPTEIPASTEAPVDAANTSSDQAAAATEAPAEPTETPAEPTAEPAVELVAVDLPAVEVYDLSTGATADLAAFAKPGPTLVWFWAPH